MLDRTTAYAPQLRELLTAGESLRTAVRCLMVLDVVQLKRSPAELEHMVRHLPGAARRWVAEAMQSQTRPGEGAFDNGLSGLLNHIGDRLITDDVVGALGGTPGSGDLSSHWAFRLAAVFEEDRSRYCVVTDRRLILAAWRRRRSRTDDTATIVFSELVSAPRESVLMARRRGGLLQRGRVELDFVDLSRLTLLTGHVFTGGARRLVCAVNPDADADRSGAEA
jgi:hypothetical protein